MLRGPRAVLVVLVFALALSGCATAPVTRADVTPGVAPLAMKAGNFSFDPDLITIHGTGTVVLTITNTSATAHNITVEDPHGKVIDSAEIPPNGIITTRVTFPAPGDYPFVCNHPLHAELGMKGRFIVTAR